MHIKVKETFHTMTEVLEYLSEAHYVYSKINQPYRVAVGFVLNDIELIYAVEITPCT